VVALQRKLTIFPCTLIYFCQSIIPAGSRDYRFLNPDSRIPGLRKGIRDSIANPAHTSDSRLSGDLGILVDYQGHIITIIIITLTELHVYKSDQWFTIVKRKQKIK